MIPKSIPSFEFCFDIENLVRLIWKSLILIIVNKGEACTATSRILVQREIYEKFVDKLAAGVKKIRMGNGLDSKTHVGPQVSRPAQQRLLEYISLGQKEGARIAAQAQLPSDPECKDGFFAPATLFADVTEDMRIAKEEMFGSVGKSPSNSQRYLPIEYILIASQ